MAMQSRATKKAVLESLLNAMPLGIIMFIDRDVVFVNKAMCDIFEFDFIGLEVETNAKEKLQEYIDLIRKREFLHKNKLLYKILRFVNKNNLVCFLIEITSLEYINQFFLSVDFAEEFLKFIFLNPYESCIVADENGIIRYMPPIHEEFWGVEHGKAIGRHVKDIIENSRLHIVAKTGKAEIGKTHKMKGVERIVSRIPIKKNGRTIGAIGKVMFRDLYQLKATAREAESLKKQVDYYKKELTNLRQTTFSLDRIIGKSPVVEQLKKEIKKASQVDLPVFIFGETGTGKDLVAHAIHNLSHRSRNPLIIMNIAAIPPELFESELFGYEPGSFTDADRKGKLGKFQLAHRSSIFIDEIGDLPYDVQSKLLRVLQEGYVEKIGSKKLIKSDFRTISATNKDMDDLINTKHFRLDLFYRINALTISVPPLRARKEDLCLLAQYFIEEFNQKYHAEIKGVTEEVTEKFISYDWPGNVRELKNEIGRACSFATGDILGWEDFSAQLRDGLIGRRIKVRSGFSRKKVLDITERELIIEALKKTGGNKTHAARLLGLSRTMLYKKLKKLET